MSENNIFMPLKNLVTNSVIIKPTIYDEINIPKSYDVKDLLNYYWIVPPETLLAFTYSETSAVPIIDQTVWKITSVNQRYFFGISYAMFNYTEIGSKTFTKTYLYGSITTDNKVHITFSSSPIITGLGEIKTIGKNNFISMQMNSGNLMHWSYMIPVKEGDYYYNNLPGTDPVVNIPEFINLFNS